MENIVVFDCEVYQNYFLIAFKNLTTQKIIYFDIYGHTNKLTKENIEIIKNIMLNRTTFGFNSLNYDIPILLYALKEKTCQEIYELSKDIIEGKDKDGKKTPTFMIMQKYNLLHPKNYKHFDIIALSPGMFNSLKLYGGRLHSQKLQELPYNPYDELTVEQSENIRTYCINDLNTSIDLFNNLIERINIRKDLSKLYKIDVMSKSDAQIAEAVIKNEMEKITGKKIYRPENVSNILQYKAPEYIKFQSEKLNEILYKLENSIFLIGDNEKYKLLSKEITEDKGLKIGDKFDISNEEFNRLPNEIDNLKVKIGETEYQMGFGGLHSIDKPRAIIPKENEILLDRDVASYYPSIILNLGLYPKHLGKQFLDIYRKLVNDRLRAKHDGNKVINECLKIVINGSFGKLGSKWSILYSPDLMLKVTITGQLALLMLIELLEKNNINVLSANTDGFVSLIKDKQQKDLYQGIIYNWETLTNFTTEETEYKALYSRDVNNYSAIKLDGSYKGKGIFTLNNISKNPDADISVIAAIEYLKTGKSFEETIRNCTDIKKFVIIRQVRGGATWNGKYLGKVVRFIYSKNGLPIYYKEAIKSGAYPKIAGSDGAYPVMELIDIPDFIDYDRYIFETKSILGSLGIEKYKEFVNVANQQELEMITIKQEIKQKKSVEKKEKLLIQKSKIIEKLQEIEQKLSHLS